MFGYANPDALHAAQRPPAALAGGGDRWRCARSASILRCSPRRPTTSRARPCGSCTCTCRPRGWRCSCYRGMAIAGAVGLIWRHPLAEIAAQAAAPIGAALHLPRPRHRLALGPADVGHLVGVGRAADLGAGAVLPLSRLHRPASTRSTIRPAARAPALDPGAGRRRQPADHQVLGRLVEHAAPAGQRRPPRRSDASTRAC